MSASPVARFSAAELGRYVPLTTVKVKLRTIFVLLLAAATGQAMPVQQATAQHLPLRFELYVSHVSLDYDFYSVA